MKRRNKKGVSVLRGQTMGGGDLPLGGRRVRTVKRKPQELGLGNGSHTNRGGGFEWWENTYLSE